MKTIQQREPGEKVRIEVEVVSATISHGELVYYLKNPQTGKAFDFTFSDEQIFPIEESK